MTVNEGPPTNACEWPFAPPMSPDAYFTYMHVYACRYTIIVLYSVACILDVLQTGWAAHTEWMGQFSVQDFVLSLHCRLSAVTRTAGYPACGFRVFPWPRPNEETVIIPPVGTCPYRSTDQSFQRQGTSARFCARHTFPSFASVGVTNWHTI